VLSPFARALHWCRGPKVSGRGYLMTSTQQPCAQMLCWVIGLVKVKSKQLSSCLGQMSRRKSRMWNKPSPQHPANGVQTRPRPHSAAAAGFLQSSGTASALSQRLKRAESNSARATSLEFCHPPLHQVCRTPLLIYPFPESCEMREEIPYCKTHRRIRQCLTGRRKRY
jgi:hypothetical protein